MFLDVKNLPVHNVALLQIYDIFGFQIKIQFMLLALCNIIVELTLNSLNTPDFLLQNYVILRRKKLILKRNAEHFKFVE